MWNKSHLNSALRLGLHNAVVLNSRNNSTKQQSDPCSQSYLLPFSVAAVVPPLHPREASFTTICQENEVNALSLANAPECSIDSNPRAHK